MDEVIPEGSGLGKALTDLRPGEGGVVSHEVFDHLKTVGRVADLSGWRTEDEATAFVEHIRSLLPLGTAAYAIRVIRDYGMVDRREAPQYQR